MQLPGSKVIAYAVSAFFAMIVLKMWKASSGSEQIITAGHRQFSGSIGPAAAQKSICPDTLTGQDSRHQRASVKYFKIQFFLHCHRAKPQIVLAAASALGVDRAVSTCNFLLVSSLPLVLGVVVGEIEKEAKC